jgi:hypothetical protein
MQTNCEADLYNSIFKTINEFLILRRQLRNRNMTNRSDGGIRCNGALDATADSD